MLHVFRKYKDTMNCNDNDGNSGLQFGFSSLESYFDFSEPVQLQQNEKKQYVMPSCYGRGLRRKDIVFPQIPSCCLHLVEDGKVSIVCNMIIFLLEFLDK